jgi:hypothetical protein
MIAVYYATSSGAYTMHSVNFKKGSRLNFNEFLDALEKLKYPSPDADVIFIENDEVIDHWKPVSQSLT